MTRAFRGRQGAPVVYNAEAHREFVTGFRQRKQQRRQKAQKLAAEKQKQERREERKQRREVFRTNRERVADVSESEDGNSAVQSTQFKCADGVVTAWVQALDFGKPAVLPRIQEQREASEFQGEQGQQSLELDKGISSPQTKATPKLGVVKQTRKSWKRKISYTHMLSKGNMRKAKLKRRKESHKNAS